MFFSSSTNIVFHLFVQQLVDFRNTNVQFVFVSGLFDDKDNTYWKVSEWNKKIKGTKLDM